MFNHKTGWLLLGVVEGALLVRFVALLFAARPDNPAIRVVLTLTAPFTAPFAALDRFANQPQFGARLELATLAAMILLLLVACVLTILARRYTTLQGEQGYAQSKRVNR